VGRHPGPLGAFFRRLAKRKSRSIAVVATARKMVTIAVHMLKNAEYLQSSPQGSGAPRRWRLAPSAGLRGGRALKLARLGGSGKLNREKTRD